MTAQLMNRMQWSWGGTSVGVQIEQLHHFTSFALKRQADPQLNFIRHDRLPHNIPENPLVLKAALLSKPSRHGPAQVGRRAT